MIQIMGGAAEREHIPLLVTELQDPLHILLGHGIIILKRLWRKNRKIVMYAL